MQASLRESSSKPKRTPPTAGLSEKFRPRYHLAALNEGAGRAAGRSPSFILGRFLRPLRLAAEPFRPRVL